jgi:hypothetical protein
MTSIDGQPYSPLSKGQSMTIFQNHYRGANRTTQFDVNRRNTYWFALPILVFAGTFIFTAQAQSPRSHGASPAPAYRVETLKLKTKGLLPNTAFAVYLSADCIGEIATNAEGRGSMRAEALVEGESLRQGLNPTVLRFASPAADDVCLTPVRGGNDGPSMRSASATTTWITGARSANSDGSIFHTINWRSIPCVSTF